MYIIIRLDLRVHILHSDQKKKLPRNNILIRGRNSDLLFFTGTQQMI